MKILTPEILKHYKNVLKRSPEVLKQIEDEKYVVYIYIILTLLTVSFFGLFAINPTLATISNLNKQYEDNKIVYEGLRQKLLSLKALGSEYEQIKPSLNKIFSAVPTTTQIPLLTRQLESLTTTHELTLEKLEFGNVELYPAKKTNSPLFSFSFNITVSGNDTNIKNFITDLMNFDRIINLERVVTSDSKVDGGGAFITGRAYFQKSQ